ncbi:MAG: ABC transporter permease, partial [Cyclobacteriaceae bacterium]
DISYIYIFGAVAFFILIIAGINYMNLATARATRRAKEVGVRKTMGSFRKQLIGQFLTESTLLTFIALGVS